MGRTGSALDNAVAEGFNSTLKVELLAAAGRFATRAQARTATAGSSTNTTTTGGTRPRGGYRLRLYEARVRAEPAA